MNKKIFMFGIPLLCLVLVSAGLINYYGNVEQEISIESPIVVSELTSLTLSGMLNSPQYGGEITVENEADFDVEVEVTNDAREIGKGVTTLITTSYVGTLELTKKTVDFTSTNWVVLNNKVQIEYTVVGADFNAEVVTNPQDGYVLVYYADNDVRFANPGEAVLVEDVAGNLPAVNDDNIVNDYSIEYPTTPHGAKIWYVPSSAIPNGVIDWGRADEFYFESSLIQYNADGLIIVYPGEVLDFTPMYEFGAINGTYIVTTEIIPA